jgi:hypothetical protein
MRKMRRIAYCWPGLPQLWAYGSWSGLGLALTAAILLDVLLAASFGWTELLDAKLRIICWSVLGVFWAAASIWSTKQVGRQARIETPEEEQDAFAEALDYYLKGDYYQTERILEDLLHKNLRDVDARLMLATLMRHTGRFDEAIGQLDVLGRFDGAEKWELEVRQERLLLADAKTNRASAA